MDKQTAMAINDLSKKINDVQTKLDQFVAMQNECMQADLDFIAMMADVDLYDDSGDDMGLESDIDSLPEEDSLESEV